ncbi:DUF87 domain-containing protein [Rossellomorea vietnamensis]|uniref:DUF87 domain-containing protein n=1 Tax=Rossellomorea vietnamensis TaxID=218284 RepID=A0ACD4C5P8_9BACI|nr:DUF87 domain-containing protein [Rossellomorea vietnamensis]UXH43979.1 DUF87 domain-containing protein [Rossellomorea vietnamensis]
MMKLSSYWGGTEVDKSDQLRVRSFESHSVQIEIVDFQKWKEKNTDSEIKIGSFLKVEDGNDRSIVTLVKSFKMVEDSEDEITIQNQYNGNFIINTQPIGQLEYTSGKPEFIKGIKNISIPPNGVNIANEEDLKCIFSNTDNKFVFSNHLINNNIEIAVNGDKFFSKHIAVVGSTGSGKSCTVAKVIQEAINSDIDKVNNTHIIIFDIHGEYSRAFPDQGYLSIEKKNFHLPYWLMNSEELENLFIESNESNSHNQISVFKEAVIKNKIRYNPNIKVTYDSPVYFSLEEVFNYICNKNEETHYIKDGKELFAIKNTEVEVSCTDFLWEKLSFEASSGNSKNDILGSKVSSKNNGYHGEFPRFISRLENKMNDERLHFLITEEKEKGKKYSTQDLQEIIEKILGYKEKNNVTIIDLSSLPFEVISIVVSIISRLIFEFCYHYTKFFEKNDNPFMLVYEEAHKYIPKINEARYRNTRIAVERVAKEGRKYGLSSMIVSQRPSELSSTVFSQCNNFIVMRLNNPEDQSYVKRLLPEAVISYGDALSSLEKREALLVGDAVATPCIVNINEACPTPQSDDIKFYTEWRSDWKDIAFSNIVKNINKESHNSN